MRIQLHQRQLYSTILSVSIVFMLAYARDVYAWPPTYGAEFEFTYKSAEWDLDGMASQVALQTKERFLLAMREECQSRGCIIHNLRGKIGYDYKITLPNGWWFVISHDPSVVEIKTKPSTLLELKENKGNINQYIFGVAHRAGFHVVRSETAHFNFGVLSAFGSDLRHFMRYFVDYHNHTHLALGSLGKDLENAPPLSVLRQEQRDELTQIVGEVEAGVFRSLPELSQAIMSRVYTHIYDESFVTSPLSLRHYQAIGLKYIYPENMRKPFADSIELDALLRLFKLDLSKPVDQPFELRAVWAQPNAETFIKIAELVEARIDFLKNQSGPIRYFQSKRKEIKDPRELKTRFYIYVVESGLRFSRFNSLLPVDARRSELAEFLRPELAIEKRLHSLLYYRDLVPISEWFRIYAENLIRSADVNLQQRYNSYLKKIEKYRALNAQGASSCARSLKAY